MNQLLSHYANRHFQFLKRQFLKQKFDFTSNYHMQYSTEFLAGMMDNPLLIRNIAVVGAVHHGRLFDIL